ncbi:MAG: hypothetical protein MN733_12500 [Nitrososphaera sp.]|nr:hypothetical protein [Nitrososphaera sp.]
MNTKTLVALTGVTCGFVLAALATGTCNHAVTVDCIAPSACDSGLSSPNCSSGTFAGTITNVGNRTAITSGSPGYQNWNSGTQCAGQCQITSDCLGLSPEVNSLGAQNKVVAPGSPSC